LFAGIGRDLTAELLSRCVPVRLVRASPAEQDALVKVRARPYAKRAAILRGRCARWVADNLTTLKSARPALPQSLDGRQQDVWEPLLAIADAMSTDIARRARQAAMKLHNAPARTLAEELLRDLLTIFARRSKRSPETASLRFRTTETLLIALSNMEERPWRDMPYSHEALTPHGLAHLLDRFDIKSGRPKHSGPHGYFLNAFLPVWRRYLTDDGSKKSIRRLSLTSAQPAQPAKGAATSGRLGRSGRALARHASKRMPDGGG
jgi:putative DNA primase/helicase